MEQEVCKEISTPMTIPRISVQRTVIGRRFERLRVQSPSYLTIFTTP